ncbi:hypothetical protein [Streptomyces hygroscopicus]|nr:hypothetical protein [Streptomyces hygroscopicus]
MTWAGVVVAGPQGPAVRQRPRRQVTDAATGFAPSGLIVGQAVRARSHLP